MSILPFLYAQYKIVPGFVGIIVIKIDVVPESPGLGPYHNKYVLARSLFIVGRKRRKQVVRYKRKPESVRLFEKATKKFPECTGTYPDCPGDR